VTRFLLGDSFHPGGLKLTGQLGRKLSLSPTSRVLDVACGKGTTAEAALTQNLSDDLRDAWERLRETAVSFGDQRIYASHKSIMFSRKSCYFFVRPKKNFLELCLFLGRTLKAPLVRRSDRASKSKVYHIIHIKHRDEVEAPITDWLQEAYELSNVLVSKAVKARAKSKHKPKSSRISAR
jgi:uncharacterized protein DUF5655